ncbi:DHA2 family efflux MFS transporter permease subunit [Sandaracinobacteroides saxicola]|uniref:DHA2 family efflux MFS transporter permease subunit n=1 Tax=Sandaracinobacteroides saxicola TaxID=2759707 RepID=A0A7G5IE86_9SPHN|nr:DHA2 family efflux MFS transporter permease subunit [Sandaracinobacteroides saxicola]QMW21678.1 DHA2 family efflux MFS transporter permease subunit [Sandaracinobacteroides saxicola]
MAATAPSPPVPPAGGDLSPRLVWAGFLAMILGNFMAILDIQIVSSSLRDIQAGVSASNDEIAWIQTSYLIAEIIAIPLSGLLGRALSMRTLFTMSALGFTLASLLCALSWNIDSLIIFRALQGFLGGAMIPTTMAALFILFPPERRGPATVLIGMVSTIAPSIGPTIGGAITDSLGWHWLFLINLLPGLVAAGVVWTLSPLRSRDLSLLKRLDVWGLLGMAAMLGSLEYVLEEGPRQDWLADPMVRNVALLMLAGGGLFFWRAFTSPNPIVQLAVFRNRNFIVGCLVAAVVGIGLYGSVYLIPLFLGQIRGYNALQIGQTMFVSGLTMFMMAPVVGKLQRRIDARLLIGSGLAIAAFGLWLNAHLSPDAGFLQLLLPQALRGMGLMMAMIPMTVLALGTLPLDRVQDGSGLFSMMRNLGGALGLAIINTLLTDKANLHRTELATAVSTGHADVQGWLDGTAATLATQGVTDPQAGAIARLAALVEREVGTMAFNDVFLTMAVAFAIVLPLVMLARKPRAGDAPAGH